MTTASSDAGVKITREIDTEDDRAGATAKGGYVTEPAEESWEEKNREAARQEKVNEEKAREANEE